MDMFTCHRRIEYHIGSHYDVAYFKAQIVLGSESAAGLKPA